MAGPIGGKPRPGFGANRLLGAGLLLAAIATAGAAPGPRVGLQAAPFGAMPDGRRIDRITLRNAHGMEVSFIAYGGIVTSIRVPDRQGRLDNVVLGFPDLEGYLTASAKDDLFFGALVGRYANRLAGGRFTLDGAAYQVPPNEPPNALHGGPHGFDKRVWDVAPLPPRPDEAGATLSLVSPDGDQGFPGRLEVTVTYTLNDRDEFAIRYQARTDRPTVPNLTNHSYFNLGGEGSGTVEDQVLMVAAEAYTPTDAASIPTGAIAPVAGTPFDFRRPRRIGDRLRDRDRQLVQARGYDHNWVLGEAPGSGLRLAARIEDPASGRHMEVLTTQPGIQIYTANGLDGRHLGPSGRSYRQTDAIAFETQHFPDSPNHPGFPSTVLRPGEAFDQTTTFRFGLAGR